MADNETYQFDWCSPPGETISDFLVQRGLTVEHFAGQLGCTRDETEDLLCGRSSIVPSTAKLLVSVVGSTESFWLSREAQYREALGRQRQLMAQDVYDEWLRELPTKDMITFGWLGSGSRDDLPTTCLRFFGVSTLDAWRENYGDVLATTAFRTSPSFQSNLGSIAAWLRQGEIEAGSLRCKKWDAARFRDELVSLRDLTREKDPKSFIPSLKERCAGSGVAVSVVRAPQNCRASGATRFLSPERPLLLLSFRYLSDDHFWFSFFHEAGHLLLHSQDSTFLEVDVDVADAREAEANAFAADMLIPRQFQKRFNNLSGNAFEIMRFARDVGVSPGIVVGQLQHVGRLRRNQLNNLKRFFEWA